MIYHHAKANPLNVFGREFYLYIMSESNDQHTSLKECFYIDDHCTIFIFAAALQVRIKLW